MKNYNIINHFLIILFVLIVVLPLQSQVWSMDKCINTAISNNKKLQLNKNNIDIGRDRVSQVKSHRLPKIKIEADYKYFIDLPHQLMPLSIFNPQIPEGQFKAAQFGVPHNINTNIQFALPIYNPAVKSKINNAKIGIEMAELQYQKTEDEVRFNISNLYYNAQIVQSQIIFVEDNLKNSNKLQTNVKLLYDQALALRSDVDKTSLQILQLNSKKEILHSSFIQILNGLKMMMGISLNESIDVENNIDYHDVINYTEKQTTDISLIKTKNRMLLGELNSIKKSALPTVMLYGSYGYNGFGYDQSPNEFLDFYPMGFAGLKASYSLFDGNITKKKKNIKLKELANNRLQLELLVDQNNLEVTNAKLQIGVSRKTVETTVSQITFAHDIYTQTLLQHKEGTASLTDILLADNSLREAQQNNLSAIIYYLKADLNLKRLTANFNK